MNDAGGRGGPSACSMTGSSSCRGITSDSILSSCGMGCRAQTDSDSGVGSSSEVEDLAQSLSSVLKGAEGALF